MLKVVDQGIDTSGHSSPAYQPPAGLPSAYTGITRVNAKDRFPSIAFWDQSDYKNQKDAKKAQSDILVVNKGKALRGSSRMNDGENVMLDFVELEDGTIVDGSAAKLIREELRIIYNELKKRDMLPKSWGLIGINARNFVYTHIYAKFPYLLLCFNDWKVIAIAGPVLSQWWNAEKKRLSSAVKVKIEKDLKPTAEVLADVDKRKAPDSAGDDSEKTKRQRRCDEVSGSTTGIILIATRFLIN